MLLLQVVGTGATNGLENCNEDFSVLLVGDLNAYKYSTYIKSSVFWGIMLCYPLKVNRPHGISQKTQLFITTAARISNFTTYIKLHIKNLNINQISQSSVL
jgi:hypothetical protein